MAEVAIVGDGTNVIVPEVEEVAEIKDVPETHEYTETEQKAIDQGWDREVEGDNKRSAKEFLDQGELLGKIKSQSNELKQIRQTLDGLSQHNKNVYQASYERALVDLRAQKVAAVKDRK